MKKRSILVFISLLLAACAASRNGQIQPTVVTTLTATAIVTDTALPLPTATEERPAVAPASSGEPVPSLTIDKLHMIDAQHGWAGTYSHDINNYYIHYLRADDGGRTWTLASPSNDFTSCMESDEAFFLDAQTAWL